MSESPIPENQQPKNTYIVRTFPVGPLQCNCTIIGDAVSKKALVVDPGGDAQTILRTLAELELKVVERRFFESDFNGLKRNCY